MAEKYEVPKLQKSVGYLGLLKLMAEARKKKGKIL